MKEIIEEFYSSFSKGNYKGMIKLYHKDVEFQDPAFGTLRGKRAMKMWEMLLSNKEASPKVSFTNIKDKKNMVTAEWKAEYLFGPKKRKVTNMVFAEFYFRDGKVIKHCDSFNIWKWSRQALGPVGYLFGWTPFMRSKIQKMANKKLDNYNSSDYN